MPRSPLYLGDPHLAARSMSPHLIPWIASRGFIELRTLSQKVKYKVQIADRNSQALEIVRDSGSKQPVTEWVWRHCLAEYLEGDAGPNLRSYGQNRSPSARYLRPLFTRLVEHIFKESCFCCKTTKMADSGLNNLLPTDDVWN